jgi:hypothetical protein
MPRLIILATLALVMSIGTPAAMGGQMPMGEQGEGQEPPAGPSTMMGRGMTGMMCPMMGGAMDPMAMMGMMGGGQMDAKAMGRMLELRGDLLKAMGEVLIKHGQAMRKEP